MLQAGRTWQPTRVDRVIEALRSSTSVVKVATDQGVGFLKGMDSRTGNESLARELLGSELATLIGLRVPPFAILEVADIRIERFDCAAIPPGPAFISRELRGSPSAAGDTFLRKLTNRNDIPLLVVFDTWIRNHDRCPPEGALDPTPNRDNLFFTPVRRMFEMVAIDHTDCLVEEDLDTGLAGDAFVNDSKVYGVFPEFRPYLNEANLRRAAGALTFIDLAAVQAIVASIPIRWGPAAAVRRALSEKLFARSRRVEGHIFDSLVPQLLMDV